MDTITPTSVATIIHVNFRAGRAGYPLGQVVLCRKWWQGSTDREAPLRGVVIDPEPEKLYGHQACLFEDGSRGTISEQRVKDCSHGLEIAAIDGEPIVLVGHDFDAFVELAEQAAAAMKEAAERTGREQQEARRREAETLLSRYVFLDRVDGTKGPHTAGAANLRRLLARAFPGVAFSVRAQTFAGGSAIDASWTDGPTQREVEAFSELFRLGSFDGMTDSYEYSRSLFPELFGGAKYVCAHRSISPSRHREVAESLGVTPDVNAATGQITFGEDQDRVYREARSTSFFTHPEAGTVSVKSDETGGMVSIRFTATPPAALVTLLRSYGFRAPRKDRASWDAQVTATTVHFAWSIAGEPDTAEREAARIQPPLVMMPGN